MKRLLATIFVLVLILGIGCGYAEEEEAASVNIFDTENTSFADTPVNKLERGLINTTTFWAEIPADMAKETGQKNLFFGSTVGVAEGSIKAVERGAEGLFDTLTCLFPPYNKPLMQPEYALTRADDNVKEYLW